MRMSIDGTATVASLAYEADSDGVRPEFTFILVPNDLALK